MKSLSTHITESLDNRILGATFEVLPADWFKFVRAVKRLDYLFLLDGDGDEILHDKAGVILARWDSDTLKVMIDLTKQEFYDVALRNKLTSIQK